MLFRRQFSLIHYVLVEQFGLHIAETCNIGLTEVYAGSIVLSNMFSGDLRRAVLEALSYSDIFEFPLRLEEIHRYLPVRSTVEQVADALGKLDGAVDARGGYFFLSGRAQIVEIRRERELQSRSLLPSALKYGHFLGSLPFIRMVALTGSLAVMNVSKDVDFDYMLVTVSGRLWTARAFALLLNHLTKRIGHTLCPNLIVAETALEWPLHDLYSARELYQMIPITGTDVHEKVIAANLWAREYLPNAYHALAHEEKVTPFRKVLELPLRGKIGNRFERWEMTRKIARFSQQPGFGEETIFNAKVCQGNFHHHRKWTQEAFEGRLANLAISGAALGGDVLVQPSRKKEMGAYKL